MPYNEVLVMAIRAATSRERGITSKKMFGGVAFMVDGRMFAGIIKDRLMVRIDPADQDEALAKPHTRPMDFTKRPMPGFIEVEAPAWTKDATLRAWLAQGLAYARAQGPKEAKRAGVARRSRTSSKKSAKR
ncbi:MAG TPA: TfoX/Sxy family protein [Candidatus Thermoplasmatota archaeon]|nr:TfoX/Sxy family protein [Candidatus Thermoplasmatota archaeon]